MSTKLNIVLALACGLILANLYYVQPIIGDIGRSLNLDESASGLIVTLAQLGYVSGILLVVPLGDRLENRALIRFLVLGAGLSLFTVALTSAGEVLLPAIFMTGLFTAAVQLIIPYGASLADGQKRGRAVGIIASGAILGIVLARPAASFLTDLISWRACFFLSALLMLALSLCFRVLPTKDAAPSRGTYTDIFKSMAELLRAKTDLRRKIVSMALVFSGFSLFWAAAPMAVQKELALSHTAVALLSLTSLAAPVCTIMAGRMADRGWGFQTALIGMVSVVAAFLLTPIFGFCILIFIPAVLLLDCGTHTSSLVTQQAVINLEAEARSRLNALYMSGMFTGGAAGSALGPWLYSHYGWMALSAAGFALAFSGLGLHCLEKVSLKAS